MQLRLFLQQQQKYTRLLLDVYFNACCLYSYIIMSLFFTCLRISIFKFLLCYLFMFLCVYFTFEGTDKK